MLAALPPLLYQTTDLELSCILKHTIKTKICFNCPLQHSWLDPANVVTKTETLNAALETWKNATAPNNSTWLWLGIPITRTITKLNNVTSIVSQNEALQSQHQHFQQIKDLISDMCHLQPHWEPLGNIHGFFNPAQSQPKATTEGPITKKTTEERKMEEIQPHEPQRLVTLKQKNEKCVHHEIFSLRSTKIAQNPLISNLWASSQNTRTKMIEYPTQSFVAIIYNFQKKKKKKKPLQTWHDE